MLSSPLPGAWCVLQAISAAVSSPHQEPHQEPPPTARPNGRETQEDALFGSTNDAAQAAAPSWKPGYAEDAHPTPTSPYTQPVGATTSVDAVAPANVAAKIVLQEQQTSRPPRVSGGGLQQANPSERAAATMQGEDAVSPAGVSLKTWPGTTAEGAAAAGVGAGPIERVDAVTSAESMGDRASPSTSAAPNGFRDNSGPWKFSGSGSVNSTSNSAGGTGGSKVSRVTNPILYYGSTGDSI